jgi:predicted 3-demethylubiquinone-9 3-methyltransferase (glyoxalase superfamily)
VSSGAGRQRLGDESEDDLMPTITPFLWFDGQAEEAMNLYVSIFARSRVVSVTPGPDGRAMSCTFELEGQTFMALNGGPAYRFTPAISLFVSCETQAEVDGLWDKLLSSGGTPVQCGWVTDRFGVSWQIIPTALGRLLGDPDRAKATAALRAMLKMQKIDIAVLERAYESG